MEKLMLCLRVWGFGLLVAAALSACGGGGGSAPPAPTAIPESLAITGPGTAESATAMAFGNSTGALAGLKYQWDFGDGSTSTEAAPSHSFASGGDFDVVLKVTNEAGTSRETRTTVSVTNLANVRGLECSGAASTGWCWQYPRPTGEFVNSTFFLDASTGWRGGEVGEIFKTTDGGATWVRQNAGVRESIQVIYFLDASTGWVLTTERSVLRTTDGGAHWTFAQTVGPAGVGVINIVANITAIDAKTVYLSFAEFLEFPDMLMFGSKDGGVTWQQISPPGPNLPKISSAGKFWRLKDDVVSVSTDFGQSYTPVLTQALPAGYVSSDGTLSVRDDQRAAAVMSDYRVDPVTSAVIYVWTVYTTVDGGVNWSKAVTPHYPRSISADGKVLTAYDDNAGWISTDSGATWQPHPSMPNAFFVSLGGSSLGSCVEPGSPGAAWKLWLSDDDGRTWVERISSSHCYDLRRIDANTLINGKYSDVTVSKDNGQTWASVSHSVRGVNWKSVAFLDAKNGFESSGLQYLATKDGGASWDVWKHGFASVRQLQFLDKSKGWLVDGDGRLYKSIDAGQTWTRIATVGAGSFRNVVFDSETLGWAVLDVVGIAWTRDGGKTWTPAPAQFRVQSLRMSDQAWLALGYEGQIYISTDSGGTWIEVDTPDKSVGMSAFTFSDTQTAWAAGGGNRVLKSEDAGRHWVNVALPELPSGSLYAITFFNAKVGWAAGSGGLILATRDGGKTWRRQASPTNQSLLSIKAVDANTAWIRADGGGLLATGTGGN